MAESFQRVEIAAHVAGRGDAVGQEEREDEVAAAGGFGGAGQVNVGVD